MFPGGIVVTHHASGPREPIVSRSALPCAQCGHLLTTPEWTEYPNERCRRDVWFCEACDYQFETEVYLRAVA